MHSHLLKLLGGALLLPLLILSACGPVKFSADTTQNSATPNGNTGTSGTKDPNTTDTGGNQEPQNLRDINVTKTVGYSSSQKLDIVLVIDDSNSMLTDNQKLAARLSGFVTNLQSSAIDWQMCVTTTRALPVSDSKTVFGASVYWQNSDTYSSSLGYILRKGTPNLSTIFQKTINYINAGWVGSDDERAIKAAYQHIYHGDLRYNPNSGCYRTGAASAYIIISDEDERSIGGDASQQFYSGELKELEEEDKPAVFAAYVKEVFGNDRRFTVNSIIVKPGDSTCKATQDADGVKSHYGNKYAELSNLTAGGIGSICDADYSTNLNLFIDKIQDSLASIPLECQPYNGNVSVSINPNNGSITSKVDGMSLVFSPAIPGGSTVSLSYKCLDGSRTPSSVGKALPTTELSFWGKIVAFFKNIF